MQQKSENGEPEVPEAEFPAVERLDGFARITVEELATIHFVKVTPSRVLGSRMLDSQIQECLPILGMVLVCTPSGWWTANSQIQKEWWQMQCQCWRKDINMWDDLLLTLITIVQDDLTWNVNTSWNEDSLDVDYKMNDNWVSVFQDMKSPKSLLRKSSDMQNNPMRKIHQNPSVGYICPGEPHQRSPNAPKFERWSQEETEWQKLRAGEAVWRLVQSGLKMKGAWKSHILLTFKNRCLLTSNLKLEEWIFVLNFCASMHMISQKKNLSNAEMESLTKSKLWRNFAVLRWW